MDLFTHVLAAGLVSEVVARIPRLAGPAADGSPLRGPRVAKEARRATADTLLRSVFAFFGAGLSHLALDALPHFGFLPHVVVWSFLPHAWIVRPVVGGVLAMAFVVAKAEKVRAVAFVACAGAIYPDVEKIAHVMWGYPWLLYTSHGSAIATYTGGYPHKVLAAIEILLSVGLVLGYLRLVRTRTARRTREKERDRPHAP